MLMPRGRINSSPFLFFFFFFALLFNSSFLDLRGSALQRQAAGKSPAETSPQADGKQRDPHCLHHCHPHQWSQRVRKLPHTHPLLVVSILGSSAAAAFIFVTSMACHQLAGDEEKQMLFVVSQLFSHLYIPKRVSGFQACFIL